MRSKFLVIIPLLTLVRAYTEYYTDNICSDDDPTQVFHIKIDSEGERSANIVRASKGGGYAPNDTCLFKVIAPKKYGILLHLDSVALYKTEAGCVDSLQINYSKNTMNPICDAGGISPRTLISEPDNNEFSMKFVTTPQSEETKVDFSKYNFALTFTAYHDGSCSDDDIDCGNSKCIWIGFRCDGVINCYNKTDESACTVHPGSVASSAIIVAVFVVIGLVSLACFIYSTCRCRKALCNRFKRKEDSIEEIPQAYSPPSESEDELPPPNVVLVKSSNAVSPYTGPSAAPTVLVQTRRSKVVTFDPRSGAVPPKVLIKSSKVNISPNPGPSAVPEGPVRYWSSTNVNIDSDTEDSVVPPKVQIKRSNVVATDPEASAVPPKVRVKSSKTASQ